MQLCQFLVLCLPLAALANVGTEGSVSDLGASRRWGNMIVPRAVSVQGSKQRLGSSMSSREQTGKVSGTFTDVAGRGMVPRDEMSSTDLRAAKKAAALEKESHKLIQKDLELRKEMQSAKGDAAAAAAEVKSARATGEALKEETQAEKDKILKQEEEAAQSGEKIDVESEVSSLQKYKEEEREGMGAVADAAISEKNAAAKAESAQRRSIKAEVKERSVKRRLRDSMKEAKAAMEEVPGGEEARTIAETKVAQVKDEFRARHEADVAKIETAQLKAATAVSQVAKLQQGIEKMKDEMKSLKAEVEQAENKDEADVGKAKEDMIAKQKKLEDERDNAGEEEDKLRTEAQHLRKTVSVAKAALEVKNARIAALELAVSKAKDDAKMAYEKSANAAKLAEAKIATSAQAIKDAKAQARREQKREEAREEKLAAMKASAVEKRVEKENLERIEEAHRKELTAIKIADKEQEARIEEQGKQKEEAAGEKKDEKTIADLEAKLKAKDEIIEHYKSTIDKDNRVEKLVRNKVSNEVKEERKRYSLLEKKYAALKEHIKDLKKAHVKAIHKAVANEMKRSEQTAQQIIKAAADSSGNPILRKFVKSQAAQLAKDDAKLAAAKQGKKDAEKSKKKAAQTAAVTEAGDAEKIDTLKEEVSDCNSKAAVLKAQMKEVAKCEVPKFELKKAQSKLVKCAVSLKKKKPKCPPPSCPPPPPMADVCKCPTCEESKPNNIHNEVKELLTKHHTEITKLVGDCKEKVGDAKAALKASVSKCNTEKNAYKKEVNRLRVKSEKLQAQTADEATKLAVTKEKLTTEKDVVKKDEVDLKEAKMGKGVGIDSEKVMEKLNTIEKQTSPPLKGKPLPGAAPVLLVKCQKEAALQKKQFLKCKVDMGDAVSKQQSAKELSDKYKKELDVCQTKMSKREERRAVLIPQ